nr:unnamed protein product [Digitaria exilis]
MDGIMASAATGVMSSLLAKLAELLSEDYQMQKGMRHQIAFLKDELSSMNTLLERLADMEVLDPQTREWRNQVREMTYDIEDCVDDYMRQLRNGPQSPGGVMGFFLGYVQKVKELVSRQLGGLVGINVPTDEVIKLLGDGDQGMKVVSIVGCGGIGKTTVANQIYRRIATQFDFQAFVSLSQNPDMVMTFRSIPSQVKKDECDSTSSSDKKLLISELRDFLKDKRYFIVIDDIWSTQAWKTIIVIFVDISNYCQDQASMGGCSFVLD